MKVILLAQIHKAPDDNLPEITYNRVARSQFSIAQYLQQRKSAFVINEGSFGNQEYDASNEYCHGFSILFPDGIPEEEVNLNPIQKKLFYLEGGANISLISGHIKVLYGTQCQYTRHIEKAVYEHDVSVDACNTIMFEREVEVMNLVQEIHKKEYPSEIIIVFGANHDFKYYCDKLGYEYERIETVETLPAEEVVRKTIESLRRSYLTGHDDPIDLNEIYERDEAFISIAIDQFNILYNDPLARKSCVSHIVSFINLNTPTRIEELIKFILRLCVPSIAREVMLTELYESKDLDPIYIARYRQHDLDTPMTGLPNKSDLKSGDELNSKQTKENKAIESIEISPTGVSSVTGTLFKRSSQIGLEENGGSFGTVSHAI